jgi:hypothetical protein
MQIEFTASGANSAIGGFSPGDRLRTSPEAQQEKPAEKPAKGKK